MTTIAELLIADHPEPWRESGFTVGDDGICQIGTVRLRIDPEASGKGLVGWVLAGVPDDRVAEAGVDGLRTAVGEPSSSPSTAADHPIGAVLIDHVVVMTPDIERTIAAVTDTLGLPLKRERRGEAYGNPMRQAFFRMGEVILEVVGGPEPDPRGGKARFFGIALTLASLDAAAALLGPDRMGAPKPAVQEGRFISTIRSAAGLGVAVALMSA
jgi:catechol 2,3-dioxygenase-like lactoylglutathione lyase family enzyme